MSSNVILENVDRRKIDAKFTTKSSEVTGNYWEQKTRRDGLNAMSYRACSVEKVLLESKAKIHGICHGVSFRIEVAQLNSNHQTLPSPHQKSTAHRNCFLLVFAHPI